MISVVLIGNDEQKLNNAIDAIVKQSYKDIQIFVTRENEGSGFKENPQESTICETIIVPHGIDPIAYAIRKCTANGAYIWILTQEMLPHENALQELMDAVNKTENNFGFLTGIVKQGEGLFKAAEPVVRSEKLWENREALDEALVPVYTASFYGLFFKSESIEKIGLPFGGFDNGYEYTKRLSADCAGFLVLDSFSEVSLDCDKGVIWLADASHISGYKKKYRNRMYMARKDGMRYIGYTGYLALVDIFRCMGPGILHKWKRIFTICIGIVYGLFWFPKKERL